MTSRRAGDILVHAKLGLTSPPTTARTRPRAVSNPSRGRSSPEHHLVGGLVKVVAISRGC